MSRVRFYLKNSCNTILKPIYTRYDIRRGERLKYYIGVSIDDKAWNKAAHRPAKGVKYKSLTLLLDTIEKFINDYMLSAKIKGSIIYSEDLKVALKKRLGQATEDTKRGDYVDYVIGEIERRKLSPKYRADTVKNYNTFLMNLTAYQNYTNNKPINFDDITVAWCNSFTNYLYNIKGHGTNHVASLSRKLNLFLRAAVEDDEISTNRIYEKRKIRVAEKYVPKIYLNETEIKILFDCDYPLMKHRNAVNLWVIDSLIGARYSDFKNIDLNKNMIEIDGQKIIKITQGKTEAPAMIPVDDMILMIDKIHSPHMISNTKLNLYIKEAAKIAKLDKLVEKISYPKGILKKELIEKYKLITVHTARRSFATNMYKKGVDTRAIMYMTGHKSEAQFLKYLRLSVEENAVMVGRFLDAKR